MTVGSIGGTYGLSGSGMDIDSIVKKLMTGQQAKADALVQKKTVSQWQKAAYNTVYDDINNFRTTVFNYKLQANLSPNKVSSSNSSVVTATANAGAADINHSLVVNNLASGVNLTSSGEITIPDSLGKKDKTSIATQFGIASSFSITISDGSSATPKTISITPDESINQVVSDINSSGLNVQGNYDSTLDRFFLSTTNTGASTQITLSSTADNPDLGTQFIQDLNLFTQNTAYDSATNTGGYATTPTLGVPTTYLSATGQNAAFKLDNTPLTEAGNTFTISAVTYNLTGVSASSTSPTSISVTNDVDTAVASVQSLVDSYNKILAEVNGKVKEERFTDYPPLTDAQKAAMKDSDIVAWNAKAQSGMLHNDTTLSSLVNNMRSAFSGPISGIAPTIVAGLPVTYNSAASIGITTGDYTEGGKLYLNTDKLRTALQANPNVLNQLFGAAGTTTTLNSIDSKSQGIAGRLYDGIKNTMDQLNQIAGTTANAQYDSSSNYAKKIIAYNTQISDGTTTFNSMQAAYYKQYNAMEVALSALSSQSSWLSSQLGTSSTGG